MLRATEWREEHIPTMLENLEEPFWIYMAKQFWRPWGSTNTPVDHSCMLMLCIILSKSLQCTASAILRRTPKHRMPGPCCRRMCTEDWTALLHSVFCREQYMERLKQWNDIKYVQYIVSSPKRMSQPFHYVLHMTWTFWWNQVSRKCLGSLQQWT